jgi:hypothetical protein
MASTLHNPADLEVVSQDPLTLVVDEEKFEKAIRDPDPRVAELHEEADALLRQYEADGRFL